MRLLIYLVIINSGVYGQANYDKQANSIEYMPTGDGLPESTILDGKVTKLDDIAPIIFLNRTRAALNCAAGFMQIDLKFEHPFFGIIYAEFEKSRDCIIVGNGTKTAKIELPLKGCGTVQNPTRVFTNNIVVRFHAYLEIDGDEVITIVCRYPPPFAAPPALPSPIPGPLLPTVQETPLKGFQILLIICGVLFLSLVLLGLAASYYCLRNQHIQVIRRHPLHNAGSEITKISETSSGHLSMYEGLKIPRAHAMVTTTDSMSESEVAIVSGLDTIPSDYSSESPSASNSEFVEMDTRSLRQSLSSNGSYENKAYVHESSYYSEQYGHRNEIEIAKHRPPPAEPKFNVEMRIKKAPLLPPTTSASSSDTEGSVFMQERNLCTIHERDETLEINSFQYKPEPPKSKTFPVYSEVRKSIERAEKSVEKNETDYHRSELRTDIKEQPFVIRKPEITSHFIDDVYLTTITEKKTIKDIERHKRQVFEYRSNSTPSKWDVQIRNYPNVNAPPPSDDSTTDWDSHSENSSIYGIPAAKPRINSEHCKSSLEILPPNPTPANWDSLVRVLDYYEENEPKEVYYNEQSLTADDKKKWSEIITTESTLRTLLTEATVKEDYERIKKDRRFEKLYEPEKWDVIIRVITPPQNRLYDQKGAVGSNRYRRKSEWDTRSRRSSLPTLYEYDSDGSSILNSRMDTLGPNSIDLLGRSRRTSRSSIKSDMDVRSMSEIMVDFARQDVPDNMSDASSYYRSSRYYDDEDDNNSLVRSLSQPSLARSASEFTESWGIRARGWDPESPEQSPRSSMRSTND